MFLVVTLGSGFAYRKSPVQEYLNHIRYRCEERTKGLLRSLADEFSAILIDLLVRRHIDCDKEMTQLPD